jgi:hypothetical protein
MSPGKGIPVTRAEGALVIKTPITHLIRGAQERVKVEISNHSEQPWEASPYYPINLSYHWVSDSGQLMIKDGARTVMPRKSIYPGQSIGADMLVCAPQEPGKYILVLTMVQERVGWFEDLGFEPVRVEVEVTS